MTKPTPHYYPFGSLIPNRSWSDASRVYRYGFNGKEKDFETANDNYDFGARIYDGRLGRWLSLDPLMKKYPDISVFVGQGNNPILFVDINGKEIIISNTETSDELKKVPTCLGEVANTKVKYSYTYNAATNQVDITITPVIRRYYKYKDVLSMNGQEEGGDLDNYIMTHENEHANRYKEDANINIECIYNGEKISGNISEVATKIHEKIFSPIESKYATDKKQLNDEYDSKIEAAKAKGDNRLYYKLKNEKAQALNKLKSQYDSDIQNAQNTFESQMESNVMVAWDKATDPNQEEGGESGVINAALNKMSKSQKNWQNKRIKNDEGVILEDCDD